MLKLFILGLLQLCITSASIHFHEFENQSTFHVRDSPTQLWTGHLGSDLYFIKNAVKFSNSDPRANEWNVPDTLLVLNEIICSKVYKLFHVPVIHHFLVLNDGIKDLPRYLLGSKKIPFDINVGSYRHSSLRDGFLVDVLVLNDDVTKNDNVMYVPKRDHFIRSDVGGGGYYTGFGSPKSSFTGSIKGQVAFMLLNEGKWRDKHLKSAYLQSLRIQDFESMWNTLIGIDFKTRLQDIQNEIKDIIINEMDSQDHSIALEFLQNFLATLELRYNKMTGNRKSIQKEFTKSLVQFQRELKEL